MHLDDARTSLKNPSKRRLS